MSTQYHTQTDTPRAGYQYEPKQVEKIVVREFNFDFPNDLDPIWNRDHVVRSHLFNGLSLTMPYLEPFLVKTMREAMLQVDEPKLLDDMRQFNGQEASHYKCHRRLNEILKTNGYPELALVEGRLAKSYEKLGKTSLRTKLAYSAGFECMTNGFTNWLITKRRRLFAHANPHIASFWLMHMVEETEHKTVAFDAYMTYSGAYWPRAIGVFHGSFHVVGYGFVGMYTALKKDGRIRKLSTILELAQETASLLRHVGPFLLRALLPNHNPRGEADPQWMQDWVEGHSRLAPGSEMPLIDTNSFDMPVPFTHTA